MHLPDFLEAKEHGAIRLAGSRIDLRHVVNYYNEGYSAEMLACEFPTLSLAQMHKVIAYYLDHREEVDAYSARCELEIEEQRRRAPSVPSIQELRQRLEAKQRAETA
jgi:uncharacterized protein (DUF433 family)